MATRPQVIAPMRDSMNGRGRASHAHSSAYSAIAFCT